MKTEQIMEYDKIIEQLCDYAVSDSAKRKIRCLAPSQNETEVLSRTKETTEARIIYDTQGNPPLSEMKEIKEYLTLAKQGGMLLPEPLSKIAQFLASCNRLKVYLTKAECLKVDLAYYSGTFSPLSDLRSMIEMSIRNNKIDSMASKELKEIRRKLDYINSQTKSKLETLLRGKKEYFSEGFISLRNGHYVVPVKKEYKHQVPGTVHDVSSSGATYFIEPTSAIRYSEELNELRIAESKEENKILYTLTSSVDDCETQLRTNLESMEAIDVVFAKAKLSAQMKAVPATINTNRTIRIVNGRHPLLDQAECVPLNFAMGEGLFGIIITGPNTGGKTVTLKTVGLMSMMAQSGLHVPCDEAELCMINAVLCDIGDGQSITENLSTFSSHIKNIIRILEVVDRESLVLLDELGSGTDPAEGMGIAIAILEELRRKECLFLATTHYPQVKEYATESAGVINAKMAFDRESLKPLYQLEIGEAGESCALYIAKRLGLPKHMLAIAHQKAYGEERIEKEGSDKKQRLRAHEEELCLLIDEEKVGSRQLPGIVKKNTKPTHKELPERAKRFVVGDSVVVHPEKKIGIVYQTANAHGEIGVQIAKVKILVNYKRLQLKVAATEMYPEDYDFSIVFDTVTNRKLRHKMEKHHVPGAEIRYE